MNCLCCSCCTRSVVHIPAVAHVPELLADGMQQPARVSFVHTPQRAQVQTAAYTLASYDSSMVSTVTHLSQSGVSPSCRTLSAQELMHEKIRIKNESAMTLMAEGMQRPLSREVSRPIVEFIGTPRSTSGQSSVYALTSVSAPPMLAVMQTVTQAYALHAPEEPKQEASKSPSDRKQPELDLEIVDASKASVRQAASHTASRAGATQAKDHPLSFVQMSRELERIKADKGERRSKSVQMGHRVGHEIFSSQRVQHMIAEYYGVPRRDFCAKVFEANTPPFLDLLISEITKRVTELNIRRQLDPKNGKSFDKYIHYYSSITVLQIDARNFSDDFTFLNGFPALQNLVLRNASNISPKALLQLAGCHLLNKITLFEPTKLVEDELSCFSKEGVDAVSVPVRLPTQEAQAACLKLFKKIRTLLVVIIDDVIIKRTRGGIKMYAADVI